jgi:ADP-glucose pyrophosphorylase
MISIKGHEYHIVQSSYHLYDLTYQRFCKTHVSHGNYVLSLIAETNTEA